MSDNVLKMKDNDLFAKILKASRSSEIDYYLICNYDAIKKALLLNVSQKQIYLTVTKESKLNISYPNFTRKLKKLENLVQRENSISNAEILSDKILIANNNNEPKVISGSQKKFEYKNDKQLD